MSFIVVFMIQLPTKISGRLKTVRRTVSAEQKLPKAGFEKQKPPKAGFAEQKQPKSGFAELKIVSAKPCFTKPKPRHTVFQTALAAQSSAPSSTRML
ncbi:hypothetical protein [Neisseria leonii]|uniref:hypothetical protein n=1 Tax=Neisseria leonii TaxID=2995413 RepID=UPI00237A2441|nr:hypothetical protein [Neisseria sp. 3986]MDD9324773.1 hypothetical protein [Neisseria sp. 3986]